MRFIVFTILEETDYVLYESELDTIKVATTADGNRARFMYHLSRIWIEKQRNLDSV